MIGADRRKPHMCGEWDIFRLGHAMWRDERSRRHNGNAGTQFWEGKGVGGRGGGMNTL